MKKRADGRYQKQIKINGKIEYFYGTSIKEINEKVLEFKNKQTDNNKIIKDLLYEWRDSHFDTIKYNTRECYKASIKDIAEKYGEMRIVDLKSKHIQEFINNLSTMGYAKQTVKIRLIVFNKLCKYALLQGYVDFNPAETVSLPKNLTVAKRMSASESINADISERIAQCLDKPLGLLAYLLLYTGCRLGEALALQWSDIDFDKNLIYIDKIIEFKPNLPYLRESTKTASGNRQVILLNTLKEVLLNTEPKEGHIININNKPISKTQYRKNWAKLELGVTAHQLRHEYATMLYNAGIDVKSAQSLLGHSSINVTMDTYTHIEKSQQAKNADKINDYLVKILLTAIYLEINVTFNHGVRGSIPRWITNAMSQNPDYTVVLGFSFSMKN